MNSFEKIAWWLVVIGALNWGLIGLGNWFGGGNWNLVEAIFGKWPFLVSLIYVLVGLSALSAVWKKFAK